MTKHCKKCATTKPAADFNRRVRRGRSELQGYCRMCMSAYSRQRKYGTTATDCDKLRDEQGGKCAICTGSLADWVVDHNHRTGSIRGLLCRACNGGLGHFKDNPSILLAAIGYLNERGNYARTAP